MIKIYCPAIIALAFWLGVPAGASAQDMADEDMFPYVQLESNENYLYHFITFDLDFAKTNGKIDMTWESEMWFGGDYNKGWFEFDGEVNGKTIEDAELQALYSRYISRFFDLQVGIRHDFGVDGSAPVTYGVLGINGVAPYWIGVDSAFYFSQHGDITFDTDLDYLFYLNQYWFAEINFDIEFNLTRNTSLGIAPGLSDIDTSLKFNYQRWFFTPYVEFNYLSQFGSSKTAAIASGDAVSDFVVRLGVSAFF